MSYGTSGSKYGSFRWGSATALSENGSQASANPPPDAISPLEAYGSGLALASNADIEADRAEYPFDLYANQRGELATRSGVPYLIQGIALRIVSDTQPLLGQTWNVNTKADLELAVARIATDDERVTEARDVSIRLARNQLDSIVVEMTIVGERAAHEAVFSLEPAATLP